MKYDKTLMNTAKIWSNESYCDRKKVGAVIAQDSRIISTGYNGTISGSENCCEDEVQGKLISKNTVVHAEANAIMYAAKNGIKTDGCTLYVTMSPCVECAKMIIQSGIKRVVYSEQYRMTDGIDFLKEHNIDLQFYSL
jgi:dCMP deaminase